MNTYIFLFHISANNCPKHSEWKECSCRISCENIQPIRNGKRKKKKKSHAKDCDAESCVPGCQCKKSFVFEGNKCMEQKRCPHISTSRNTPQVLISKLKS